MKKENARKIFVLDTNVLMSTHGYAIYGFKENDVVITSTTLEELDNCKTYVGEAGYEAREAIRVIHKLLNSSDNSVLEGIPLPEGGTFRIESSARDIQKELLPLGMSLDKPDNRIIGAVIGIENKEPFVANGKTPRKVVLVTNDIAMKIKAEAAGINTETYHNDQSISEHAYTGRAELPAKTREDFSSDITDLRLGKLVENTYQLEENQYVLLKYGTDGILAKARNGRVEKLEDFQSVYGVTPRNSGQRFALDALMAPVEDIPMVILSGPAGCGKTLLSIATGLEQISYDQHNNAYRKMVIMRSNTLSDNDQGFLKGDLNEKMMPLLAPYFDNLEYLFSEDGSNREDVQMQIDDRLESGSLEIGCFAYIRGRSFANTYLIIDEAQNLTRNQAKTLVTRVGNGTKLVIMGDPDQIDNPRLNKDNNGLGYLIEKFRGSKLCAQVAFNYDECVRSPLANEALERL